MMMLNERFQQLCSELKDMVGAQPASEIIDRLLLMDRDEAMAFRDCLASFYRYHVSNEIDE